jgi:predicted O-methyltransferase YrrM
MWHDRSRAALKGLTIHPETWVRFEDIGQRAFPYRPNVETLAPAIARLQHALEDQNTARGASGSAGAPAPVSIPAAMKLAELTSVARGNVIEFTARDGCSTALIAQALRGRRSGPGFLGRLVSPAHVLSIDGDGARQRRTIARIGREGLAKHVKFAIAPATIAAYGSIELGKRYGLCFIDHAAAYEQMKVLCTLMRDLIARSGFVVVGNYLYVEPGTRSPDRDLVQGIHRAVRDGLDSAHFAFVGCYGTAAVFLKT